MNNFRKRYGCDAVVELALAFATVCSTSLVATLRKKCRLGILLYKAGLICLGTSLTLNAWATLALTAGDTYVNALRPNSKHGTSEVLFVDQDATTLIRFDLTTLPAGTIGLDIDKATVMLSVRNVLLGRFSIAGSVTVFTLASPWDEATVTFDTRPALGSAIVTLPIARSGQRYVTVDVTAVVRSWLDSGNNYGLAVVSGPIVQSQESVPTMTSVTFDSKEGMQGGIPPMLDITLVTGGSAGPPGPPGPQGPAGSMGATGPAGPAGSTRSNRRCGRDWCNRSDWPCGSNRPRGRNGCGGCRWQDDSEWDDVAPVGRGRGR